MSTNHFIPLHKDPAQSVTLPGFYYNEPAIFEREKEQIFYKSWQLIAHVSELDQPGSYVCGHIVDQHVFVVRGKDGKLRGFYNVCQHRAHELLQGKGQVKGSIICPYHAWTFATDGALQTARHCEHIVNFDKSEFGLAPVRTEEMLGFIFVNLDPNATPLSEQAGDMFADIQRSTDWWDKVVNSDVSNNESWEGSELPANWKVLAENCLECYHCGPAHPAFTDLIEMKSYKVEPSGPWIKSSGDLKKAQNSAYNVDPSEPSQSAMFWYLWPNMAISTLPGEASLGAFRFYPVAPGLTRMTSIILTLPGETIKPERTDYRWHVLWLEDEAICESVHNGLKSRGYKQGRFVINKEREDVSEHAVHYFQQMYSAVIDEK